MSDWTDGYAAAIRDLSALVQSRNLMTAPLQSLLADLRQDALVIEIHATIAPWRRDGMRPHTAWRLLTGISDLDATWCRVEQYMSAWLASREQSSLQRVG